MEKILAIDPGERVGWASGIVYPEATVEGADGMPKEEATSLDVTDQGVHQLKDFAMSLGKNIEKYDTVVYETWRLYPNMAKRMVGNDMQPSQLVGIIRYLGWIHPQINLVMQGANIKKTAEKTMPDWMIEQMTKSSEQHDQDALMHLWHYYWSKYV
jgi:hypothetical protein